MEGDRERKKAGKGRRKNGEASFIMSEQEKIVR